MIAGLFQSRFMWLALGTMVGLVVGGLLSQPKLDAVATDSQSDFTIATGQVDVDVEGVFTLDHLTGDLTCFIINRQTRQFSPQLTYRTNVKNDLKLEPGKQPKFLMVTGTVDLQPLGGQTNWAPVLVYVAETTTGNMAVYGLPYIRNTPTQAFQLFQVGPIRAPLRTP